MIIDCPACNHRHLIHERADGTLMRCHCSHEFRLPVNQTEDPATKCSNCGANPPAGTRHCPFCDAHLTTVRCARCKAQNVEGDRHCRACGHEHGASLPASRPHTDLVLSCPRCDNDLRATTTGDTTIDDCERCGGVWLDLDVFEHALSQEKVKGNSDVVAAVQALTPASRPEDQITPETGERFYLACPHCKKMMHRRQFAKVSRVIVDVCKDHGIWLDHDELPRIVRFVQDGGLHAARKQQLEQQVDSLLQGHRGHSSKPSLPSRRYEFGQSYGNPLLEVVAGVLSLLFR